MLERVRTASGMRNLGRTRPSQNVARKKLPMLIVRAAVVSTNSATTTCCTAAASETKRESWRHCPDANSSWFVHRISPKTA
jgi:hypothetical protein